MYHLGRGGACPALLIKSFRRFDKLSDRRFPIPVAEPAEASSCSAQHTINLAESSA